MDGIGSAPFPITSKNPEVQEWFNQGNALLHSFWFEEAERSFRWCLKLDPDCAMAYWGLARCGFTWFRGGKVDPVGDKRFFDFLKEAEKRKDKVSERERMYIEAWSKGFDPSIKEKRFGVLAAELQKIAVTYPQDIEAKALLAFFNIGQGSALANEMLIREVLAANPMHPGAHHARIHNWDGVDAVQALPSCQLYGKAAPSVGHALHMPGHCYTKMGMWHEAAWAMDSATRTELKYMNDRLALPFETWNYPHNRDYLCYIQEQLGLAEASIRGAKDMLAAPSDPQSGQVGGYTGEGIDALTRALVKFERWDHILKPGFIPWPAGDEYESEKAFCEVLAYSAKGRLTEARLSLAQLQAAMKKDAEKYKDFPGTADYTKLFCDVAEGLLLLKEGNDLDGEKSLLDAAELEQAIRDRHEYANDPPSLPWPVMRLIGDHRLARGDAKVAVDAYQRALKNEPNDGFSLCGLAMAYAALGDRQKAKEYAGRFVYVWSGADPKLKWVGEVAKLNLDPKPVAVVPAPERAYRPEQLAHYGPSNWEPFAAPELDCKDADGHRVRLSDYRGKNVLLVFYLNASCVHCVEQLQTIDNLGEKWADENTVVLAVSSTPPAKNKAANKLGDLKIKLLSDQDHVNARRFSSYDDFEEMELHSTILIDRDGKVRWKRTGGDPFSNTDFLLGEIARINKAYAAEASKKAS